jgi:hypothetical protein
VADEEPVDVPDMVGQTLRAQRQRQGGLGCGEGPAPVDGPVCKETAGRRLHLCKRPTRGGEHGEGSGRTRGPRVQSRCGVPVDAGRRRSRSAG